VQWRKRQFFLSYWSENALEKENLLHALMEFLLPRKYLIAIGQGWTDCDVTVYRGIWSKADLKVAVEHHGGGKRVFRTRCRVRESWLSRAALLGFAVVTVIAWLAGLKEIQEVAVLLGSINLVVVAVDNFRLGRIMYHVLEVVGKQIQLTPVNGAAK